MSDPGPLISAIIPTRRRPHLVVRAVHSALAQSVRDLEVVVSIDGPDAATRAALARVDDPRLRVIANSERRGQAGATNAAIAAARGTWVALLDDDDLWRPEKLARQLRAATACRATRPVVGCRVLRRGEGREETWPRRTPKPDEPIGRYLFERSDWRYGEGFFNSSMLFAPRELFAAVPLGEVHGDWDWLLRVAREPGVAFVFPDTEAPLCVWEDDRGRERASLDFDRERSLGWARGARRLLSPRSYASLLLRIFAADAKAAGDWGALLPLVRDAFRHGAPGWADCATFGAIWLTPDPWRRRAARASSKRQP